MHQSSSLLPLGERHRAAFPDAVPVGTVDVEVVRLDEQLSAGSLGRPALLKLDVQGYELEALRGAAGLLPEFRWVVLEASFAPLYDGAPTFDEIHAAMQESGFALSAPVGHLCDPATGEYLQVDVLFEIRGS